MSFLTLFIQNEQPEIEAPASVQCGFPLRIPGSQLHWLPFRGSVALPLIISFHPPARY